MIESEVGFGAARRARYEVKLPGAKPKALAAWLDELPLTNVIHCFDAVEAVLEYFNADTGIPAATRLELAELLTPTVALLAGQAEAHFLDAPLPYHPKAEFYAGVAFRIQYGLGTAYALAAFDVKPSSRWFGNSGNQPLKAVYRALRHLGLAQLRIAQQYLTIPMEFWSTLFRLYRHAEIHGLLQARCDDADESEACKTPMGIFKRSLLFDLASTRHLRQREMARVYDLLGFLSDHAKWSKEASQGWNSAEFVIYLDQDRPPSRSHPDISPNETGVRFLYTWDLSQMLATLAEESMAGISKDKPALDEAVLLSVARNLQGIQRRKGERKMKDGICRCAVGLNKLVTVLSNPPAPEGEPAAPGIGAVSAKVAKTLGLVAARDVFSEDFDLRSEVVLPKLLKRNQLSREEIWVSKEAQGPETAITVEGRIANAGMHDYCIVWPMGQVAEIKVGELIGVGDQDKSLFIGVIRWLHCGEGRVRFGVELLTLSAEVVELLDANMKPMAKGLLLPPEPGLRNAPELLALPGKIHPGGMVRNDGRFFRAQTLLKNAASFSRFAMSPVQPA